jgi:hypothetical protein
MTHEVQLTKTKAIYTMTYPISAGHPSFPHSGIRSSAHCSWQRWFEPLLWTSSGVKFHDNGPLIPEMIAAF